MTWRRLAVAWSLILLCGPGLGIAFHHNYWVELAAGGVSWMVAVLVIPDRKGDKP